MSTADFFEVLKTRRSVRVYKPDAVPAEVVKKVVENGFLAPNSSNMQTCQVHWVKTPEKKVKLVEACLNQSAARTAPELLVVVSDRGLWKWSQQKIIKTFNAESPKALYDYYQKLVPFTYGLTFLAPIKWLIFNVGGLFRPLVRRPWSPRDIDEICIKSAALVSENIMLTARALGYDTCPMEGFDEVRVKKLLGLQRTARVVMVISLGKRDEKGIWGEQYRHPLNETFIEH
ncbi:MAG: nitroreductase family protein [Bdellovibrionia bacterium]